MIKISSSPAPDMSAFRPIPHPTRRLALLAGTVACALVISGCTVITVAGAAVGVAAVAAGTAVDVAVGTAKVGAKVGGKAIDLAIGD